MTAFAVALTAALLASNWLWLREMRRREHGWDQERLRLLNRILHPAIPQHPEQERVVPDEEFLTQIQDDFALVGTIQTNEDGDGS